MKLYDTIRNSLKGRALQIIPPPVSYSSKSFIIGFFLLALVFAGCEKTLEPDPNMQVFYEESLGLFGVTPDSVQNFFYKYDKYTHYNPESRTHPLYHKIYNNIYQAAIFLHFELRDGWDGTIYIGFDFGGDSTTTTTNESDDTDGNTDETDDESDDTDGDTGDSGDSGDTDDGRFEYLDFD